MVFGILTQGRRCDNRHIGLGIELEQAFEFKCGAAGSEIPDFFSLHNGNAVRSHAVEHRMGALAETAYLTRVVVIADLDLRLFTGNILDRFTSLAEKNQYRTMCGNINSATDRTEFCSVSQTQAPSILSENSGMTGCNKTTPHHSSQRMTGGFRDDGDFAR